MSHSHGHGHGHGHDDHGHHHDHDHSDEIEPALQKLLYSQIDFDKIVTLNEEETDSGAKVIRKTWSERLDPTPVLKSDADEQLIVIIPFAGSVKLHSVVIRTSDSDSSPRTLKLFCNVNELDFDTASDSEPTQTLTLSQTSEIQDMPVKRAQFNNTYSLALFFEDSYGSDVSEVFYIALKGEFMALSREPVEVLYEKAADPKDHAPIVGIGGVNESNVGRGM